jgi:hypothetical protein
MYPTVRNAYFRITKRLHFLLSISKRNAKDFVKIITKALKLGRTTEHDPKTSCCCTFYFIR